MHLLLQLREGGRLSLAFLLLQVPLVLHALLLFHDEHVFVQAVDKVLTHLLIGLLVKFKVVPILIKVAMERCLYRVAIDDPKLLAEENARRLSLGLLVFELAGVVAELLCLL